MPISAKLLEKRVTDLSHLPTLPGVVHNISKLADDKKSSAADVAEIISTDQVITAKVLRLVNSPVYGFPGRISSITHALVLLGFNVVKGLVLGTAVFDNLGKQSEGMWEHSLGCAVLARRIAVAKGIHDVEEVMIAGLLHDFGKVVLSFLAPADYQQAVEITKRKHCHIALAERDVFTVDHCRVASWLADEWHLPPRLADPVTYHHRPDLAKRCKDVTAVVHLADILARALNFGYPGDDTMPKLDETVAANLGISDEQLGNIVKEAEVEYTSGLDIFASGD